MEPRLFLVIRRDKLGMAGLRAQTRPEHLSWLAGSALRVRLAGPLLDSAKERPEGSVFFVEARTANAVRLWANEDPYFKAGVFQSTEVRPFDVSLGGFVDTESEDAAS